MAKKNASHGTGNRNNTARPYFVIANVEGDIRRKGKSTAELCEKYGKTPEEIDALISRAYHGSENRVRELTQTLQANDKRYEQRMAAQMRRNPEKGMKPTQIVAEKTPQEIQQDRVDEAKQDLDAKRREMSSAEDAVNKATARKNEAQDNLTKAKAELNRADDELMMAVSRRRTAEQEFNASKASYDSEVAKLNDMAKIKLLHISSVKEGIPTGKVYMSAYDYAKLSAADKLKVTPVNTEGSTFANYPEDFYDYPRRMSMDEYQSACQYALAYVKLILDGEDEVELRCKDEVTKNLAHIQQA